METNKLIICQGVPASGKTTWAKNHINNMQESGDYSWVRVNRDDLRRSTGVNYHFKNEAYITEIEHAAIFTALNNGLNVISDNTNLNPKFLNQLTDKCEELSYQYEIKEFNITFEEALRRDAGREGEVGKKVLKQFFSKYFPEYRKKVDPRVGKEKYAVMSSPLPLAIICDIDGTISMMNGRDPFIGEDCETDIPNQAVINVLQTYKERGVEIILFSGRNGTSQLQTEIWLNKHSVPMDQLHMREEKNYEKDDALKERFYNDYVRGKYEVLFVMDDRDQVVDLWRNKLNLPCFQVYYGDF